MRLPRGLAACAVTVVAIGVASGCGDDGPAAQARDGIGQPVRLADCDGWNDADARERYDTVEALRQFAGDRTGSPAGRGQTLDDEAAYDLIERSCEPSYARSFRLYKLYTRAAAFSSLGDGRR